MPDNASELYCYLPEGTAFTQESTGYMRVIPKNTKVRVIDGYKESEEEETVVRVVYDNDWVADIKADEARFQMSGTLPLTLFPREIG